MSPPGSRMSLPRQVALAVLASRLQPAAAAAAAALALLGLCPDAHAAGTLPTTGGADLGPDTRLREVVHNPMRVLQVLVRPGTVTLVELEADEAITDVATGLGADCNRADATWCIAAPAGGRHLFIKPRSTASAPNNLIVITNRRTHLLRLELLPPGDPRQPTYRLVVKAPAAAVPSPADPPVAPKLAGGLAPHRALPMPTPDLPPLPTPPSVAELVDARLQARPVVRNTQYALAEGEHAQDIVPTLIFDDGRFTYLRFPGNREVPAVFHVQADGSETLVNARMEDDLLVVDRVSRQLRLRAGAAVVALWNEAFDLDGQPPTDGTTVPGLQRLLRTEADMRGSRTPPRRCTWPIHQPVNPSHHRRPSPATTQPTRLPCQRPTRQRPAPTRWSHCLVSPASPTCSRPERGTSAARRCWPSGCRSCWCWDWPPPVCIG